MADIVDRIKKKQEKIKDLETERARQEGQEKQLLQQLKDETGAGSVGAGEKKLEELGQELVKNEKFLEGLDMEMDEIITNAVSKVVSADVSGSDSGSE